jgi:predicted ATPase
LQARVADLFAASVRQSKSSDTKITIIAETHSEAMINRLGQLVSRGKLDASDVQIVVFNKPDPESKTSVSVATFSPDGRLMNWPLGFFLADEE